MAWQLKLTSCVITGNYEQMAHNKPLEDLLHNFFLQLLKNRNAKTNERTESM